MRRVSRTVKAGSVKIGGNAEISVQSMLNVPADDVEDNIKQAVRLEKAGCDIIRAAVPDIKNVQLIPALKSAVSCPIVADIHFDYKIAIECVKAGVDKIRINPGNIGSADRIRAVAKACGEGGVPIRIGINSGSLEKQILKKYGAPTAEALCESALKNAAMLEEFDFKDIVISIKSSSAGITYEANRLLGQRCDYPLHLGVTEAGAGRFAVMKSSAAIGGLLLSGVGDTVRISLTDDPVEEVKCANELLKAIGLKKGGVNIVSCPTCGRTKIDLISIVDEVSRRLKDCKKDITVAVMGCVVNGPGEAREADIGIAGGDKCAMIFKKGEPYLKVSEEKIVDALIDEIEKMQ